MFPRSYLVTFCVKDRQPVFSERRNAHSACHAILRCRTQNLYHLYAYCVMPDHVHLAIRLADKGMHISRVVGVLKSAILYDVRQWVIGFRWQRGFHDRLVRKGDVSTDIIRYVLQNPMRAGLVRADEQYPYAGIVDPWF
jgi:putative transposase